MNPSTNRQRSNQNFVSGDEYETSMKSVVHYPVTIKLMDGLYNMIEKYIPKFKLLINKEFTSTFKSATKTNHKRFQSAFSKFLKEINTVSQNVQDKIFQLSKFTFENQLEFLLSHCKNNDLDSNYNLKNDETEVSIVIVTLFIRT